MTKRSLSLIAKGGAAALALSFLALSAPVQAQEGSNYEIIRSSADRIWRLNKDTGEVSVCTMEGDRLICTTSEDAAVPPAKTYEELEAEREALEKEQAEARADERERQLSMLDRILEMVRELAGMAADNEAARDAESL